MRRAGRYALLVVAGYLVLRGGVELLALHPGRPLSYRDDWGGPHLLGVLVVHVGPGVLAAGPLVRCRKAPVRAARQQDGAND